ncbi:Exo endo phos 2 domain containing protein [Asbolus verrucosus]|uniref:Exo endo phos 2 domain containing protein n=1 Tax=Asbolus verrucosus TaxID=1661398 RepID=A0A482WAX0_ASBVE|nr:Exo endo phos 2 domain containing protein [Asbolus verrucosus]
MCKRNVKGKFTIKYTSKKVVLNTEKLEDHNKLKEYIEQKKIEYHTYATTNSKTHGFVIRGLENNPEPEEVKEELKKSKIDVKEVYKMKKTVRPMYLLITSAQETIKSIIISVTSVIITFNTKIVTWNANGIRHKIDELIAFVDVMAINETKLNKNDKFKIKNYNVIRQDRDDGTRAGGVAIIIRKGITFKVIKNMKQTSFEKIAIKLTVNGITVIAVYNKTLNNFTENDLKVLNRILGKVIIMGDFNAKHLNWGCNRINTNGTVIKNFNEKTELMMHFSDEPTHFPENNMTPTTIDIFLTKNINIEKPTSLYELNSDHNPVVTHIEQNKKQIN